MIGRGLMVHLLAAVLCSFTSVLSVADIARASESADLMDVFEHLCIDNSLEYSVISSSAAANHFTVLDQSVAPIGGANVQTSIWLVRKQPSAALIVVNNVEFGKVSMCGIADHTTPLSEMANELALRIRTHQLPTRGIGVNDVQLEDNRGTVHIVSDPGGTSASGFFLFRDAPRF